MSASFTAAELAPFEGQYVAFSADGTRILAAGPSIPELVRRLAALGIARTDFEIEPIPPADVGLVSPSFPAVCVILRFHYRERQTNKPVFPLRGRWARPRPIVRCRLINPVSTDQWIPYPGWLDTGSEDTLFPADLADLVGIDLSNAVQGTSQGVGGTAFSDTHRSACG